MHKFIVSFCFLLATISIQAALLDGIRIETTGEPVLVVIDGQEMNTPSASCFIANLRRGQYRIEVYSVFHSRQGERHIKRKDLLYQKSIVYSGTGIENIFINERTNHRSGSNHPGTGYYYEGVMEDGVFGKFLRLVKDKPFDSERTKMISNATLTSYFTSEQCKRIIAIYAFDSEKAKTLELLYPRVVDPQNFFIAIEVLTFQGERDKVYEFVRGYEKGE